MVLRTLEVQPSNFTRQPFRILEAVLPTITSPVFSEVVIIFSDKEVCWLLWSLSRVLRGVHEVKKFRLSFCLETTEDVKDENLQALRLATQAGVPGEGLL